MLSTSAIIGSKSKVTIPDAPTATAATNVAKTSFTANCDPVVDATSYRLDVSTASNFSSYVTGYFNKQVLSTSDSVTGLTSDTTYYYRWRAVNAAGTSANSNTITQATLADAPATPTGLSVWESGIRSWSASWNSSSGATGYKIRFRLNGGLWAEVDNGTSTTYSSMFRYDPCDYVEVQVLAYNSGGDSAWSSTVGIYIDCF